ncbi:TAP42-like protein [Gongronella butleri]|nr:TAP42-like protein [Gongronella butleri]
MDTSLSLGELFAKGQSLVAFLEDTTLPSTDFEYQAKVQEATHALEQALHLIDRSGMFSSNELIDDVAPSDLKFLLTSSFLGNVMLKSTNGKISRADVLDTSKKYYTQFLSTCQDHQLMSKADLQYYEQQASTVRRSAAEQREGKIARYKREKALKETMQQLRQQLDEAQAGEKHKNKTLDDDLEREWVLAMIDMEILRALEQLHGIDQEIVMVKEMERMQLDRDRQQGVSAASSSSKKSTDYDPDRLDTLPWSQRRGGPLLSKEGRPLQPFVITNKRQQIKDQVFRPGHNLPTMTIDEYLEQERERGGIIEGGGEPPEKKEIEDNDYEALDAETMKKREWDEFTEANPRGWGNRGNKG